MSSIVISTPPGSGDGSGDVSGPASSTANAIPRYSGTSGKALKGSGVTVDDGDQLTAAALRSTEGTLRLDNGEVSAIFRGTNIADADKTFDVPNKNGTMALEPQHSTLTYAATTTIDFADDNIQTVTLTGNITFASTGRAAGRSKTIRIIGDSVSRTLAFPAEWKFVGSAAPTALAADKTAILTITLFGTTDDDAVAAYAVEP
jgi:hypothetical protein